MASDLLAQALLYRSSVDGPLPIPDAHGLRGALAYRRAASGFIALADVRSALQGIGAPEEVVPLVEAIHDGSLRGKAFLFVKQRVQAGEPPTAADLEQFLAQIPEEQALTFTAAEEAAVKGTAHEEWFRNALRKVRRDPNQGEQSELYQVLLKLPRDPEFLQWVKDTRLALPSMSPERVANEMVYMETDGPPGEASAIEKAYRPSRLGNWMAKNYLPHLQSLPGGAEDQENFSKLTEDYLPMVQEWYFRTRPPFLSEITLAEAIRQALHFRRHEVEQFKGEYDPLDPRLVVYGPNWEEPHYDGNYIIEMKSRNDLTVESARMSNCVGTDPQYAGRMERGEGRFFSVRTKEGEPIVTFETSPDLQGIREIYGQGDEELAEDEPETLMVNEWREATGLPVFDPEGERDEPEVDWEDRARAISQEDEGTARIWIEEAAHEDDSVSEAIALNAADHDEPEVREAGLGLANEARTFRSYAQNAMEWEEAEAVADAMRNSLNESEILQLMGINGAVDYHILSEGSWDDEFLQRAYQEVEYEQESEVLRYMSEAGLRDFADRESIGERLIEMWREDGDPFDEGHFEVQDWLDVEDDDIREFLVSKMWDEDEDEAWDMFSQPDQPPAVHAALAAVAPFDKGVTLLEDPASITNASEASDHDVNLLAGLAEQAPADRFNDFFFWGSPGFYESRAIREAAQKSPGAMDPAAIQAAAVRLPSEDKGEGDAGYYHTSRQRWVENRLETLQSRERAHALSGQSQHVLMGVAGDEDAPYEMRATAIRAIDDPAFLRRLFDQEKDPELSLESYAKGWWGKRTPAVLALERLKELGHKLDLRVVGDGDGKLGTRAAWSAPDGPLQTQDELVGLARRAAGVPQPDSQATLKLINALESPRVLMDWFATLPDPRRTAGGSYRSGDLALMNTLRGRLEGLGYERDEDGRWNLVADR